MRVPTRPPTGLVTFLFTDIEGSTRLVQELGTERWLPILARHRELLRGAWTANGGLEQLVEGDGFFVAFADPVAAVRASADAQRAIAAEAWPDGAAVKVRIGVHLGEGTLDADGTYAGPDVHRAARIGAAGHGGQVVLSETVAAAVRDRLPPGTSLRSLGEHRLKDLRPEPLAELRIDGVSGDFPPIRSLDVRPNNLPTQLTSFVGRERELAETQALLATTRLLTLTGPGGTGKTRLALQLAAAAADGFPDGVTFVELAPVTDPDNVPTAIANALRVSERPDRPTSEVLVEALAGKRALLVLDNLEQVLDAAGHVGALLRGLPRLTIVATSRAPLRVSGEQEYPVPGLPAPADPTQAGPLAGAARRSREEAPAGAADLERFEAVRLFVARAAAVRPGFALGPDNAAAVAAICARLEGMPLAIELAAARVRFLTPAAILARLEHQLDVLAAGSRDLPERQRSLRGAIAWSHDLLDEPCRRLFERLAVFAGPMTLEAAEAVCGPPDELGQEVVDGLESLVDQSLARLVEGDGQPRYRLLEPIREFALERLEARGDAEVVRERHARFFLDLAQRAEPELTRVDQRRWLDDLEAVHDDLRAALAWAAERPEPAIAIGLAFALWRFWQQRGHVREGWDRVADLLARPWSADDDRLRLRLLEAAGGLRYWAADFDGAGRYYGEAVTVARRTGDRAELAKALYDSGFSYFRSEGGRRSLEHERAFRAFGEALELYRELGDGLGAARTLWGIGTAEYFHGRLPEARDALESALELLRTSDDRTMEAWAQHQLGSVLLKLGEPDRAEPLIHDALGHFHAASDLGGVTLLVDDHAALAQARGDVERALRLYGAARSLARASGVELADFSAEQLGFATPEGVGVDAGTAERLEAEGAAMTLDEAVAFALGTPAAEARLEQPA